MNKEKKQKLVDEYNKNQQIIQQLRDRNVGILAILEFVEKEEKEEKEKQKEGKKEEKK